jgi:hypothetical protein
MKSEGYQHLAYIFFQFPMKLTVTCSLFFFLFILLFTPGSVFLLFMQFSCSNPRRSILEEVEVERRARIEREAEAREMNPFFNQDYRY